MFYWGCAAFTNVTDNLNYSYINVTLKSILIFFYQREHAFLFCFLVVFQGISDDEDKLDKCKRLLIDFSLLYDPMHSLKNKTQSSAKKRKQMLEGFQIDITVLHNDYFQVGLCLTYITSVQKYISFFCLYLTMFTCTYTSF